MARMNSRTRKKKYPILVERDGECCFICHNPGNIETLKIDHWDNNNSNNKWDNLHLLCQPCNVKKNKNDAGEKSPIRVCAGENDELKPRSAEFEKNGVSEPLFRRWLFTTLRGNCVMFWDDLVDAGAESARCSQETIRRYLRKVTSLVGIYSVDYTTGEHPRRIVHFKPEYQVQPMRKEEPPKQLPPEA